MVGNHHFHPFWNGCFGYQVYIITVGRSREVKWPLFLPHLGLVGGWTNPFEKYARQNGSFPQVGVKIKNIWNHHLVDGVFLFVEKKISKKTWHAPHPPASTVRIGSDVFFRHGHHFEPKSHGVPSSSSNIPINHTHTIHGTGIFTYIWLFLMVRYGKCRYIYHTWMLWDRIHETVIFTYTFTYIYHELCHSCG